MTDEPVVTEHILTPLKGHPGSFMKVGEVKDNTQLSTLKVKDMIDQLSAHRNMLGLPGEITDVELVAEGIGDGHLSDGQNMVIELQLPGGSTETWDVNQKAPGVFRFIQRSSHYVQRAKPEDYKVKYKTHRPPKELLVFIELVTHSIIKADMPSGFANGAGFPGEVEMYTGTDEFGKRIYVARGHDVDLGWYITVSGDGFLPTLLTITAVRNALSPKGVVMGLVVPVIDDFDSNTVAVTMFEVVANKLPKVRF